MLFIYNADFAVVIGKNAFLKLPRKQCLFIRYLLTMNIYTMQLVKNNGSRILRDLITALCVL